MSWSRALTARAALRVLPWIGRRGNYSRLTVARRNLALLRATAISWIACKVTEENLTSAAAAAAGELSRPYLTTVDESYLEATDSYAYGSENAAAYAAYVASGDRRAVTGAFHYGTAWFRPHADGECVASSLVGAVQSDAEMLENYRFPSNADEPANKLACQRLWYREPDWFGGVWRECASRLSAGTSGFECWIDWFERRVAGEERAFDLESGADRGLMYRLIRQDDAFWSRHPAIVNAEISEWIAAAGRDRRDFFISYASADRMIAEEINNVLLRNGYTTFVQFDDIGTGANFVREMQRGLAKSERLIAVLSPDYESSDHCQAEWAAAYAMDPGATKSTLLQFLVQPTELNPLSRQVVYTSLIGCDKPTREQAILNIVRKLLRHAG